MENGEQEIPRVKITIRKNCGPIFIFNIHELDSHTKNIFEQNVKILKSAKKFTNCLQLS